MSIHRIGDLVRVDMPESPFHGMECVVLSGLEEGEFSDSRKRVMVHEISLRWSVMPDRGVGYPPENLIPISRLTVDELADAKEVA